ncbi:PEP-CTERM sorting domain-containing protein [Pontiellaceae bacterium B12227]|nr:PEP-CTERM sorting domain-containing protein [Pontiellaceae bacterium B12227]
MMKIIKTAQLAMLVSSVVFSSQAELLLQNGTTAERNSAYVAATTSIRSLTTAIQEVGTHNRNTALNVGDTYTASFNMKNNTANVPLWASSGSISIGIQDSDTAVGLGVSFFLDGGNNHLRIGADTSTGGAGNFGTIWNGSNIAGDPAIDFESGFNNGDMVFSVERTALQSYDLSWTWGTAAPATATVSGFTFDSLDNFLIRVNSLQTGSPDSQLAITNFTSEVIPEPATLGLVAMVGGGLLFIRRRFMI